MRRVAGGEDVEVAEQDQVADRLDRVLGAGAQEARDLADLLHARLRLGGVLAVEDVHGGEDELRPADLEGRHQRRARDLLGRDLRAALG